jgi:hypothetical protein
MEVTMLRRFGIACVLTAFAGAPVGIAGQDRAGAVGPPSTATGDWSNDLPAQRRGVMSGGGGTSTSRMISPSVVASWISHENYADGSTVTLMVLWRGTPGWFLKQGRGGAGGASGSGSGVNGSYAYEYVSEGGLTFMMEFDYDKRIVKLLNEEISLKETNVVLVDFVDGPNGPTIVGSRWVDPALPGRPVPGDPFAGVIKRAPELFDYLQCDARLSDPVMQHYIPILCGQMHPQ